MIITKILKNVFGEERMSHLKGQVYHSVISVLLTLQGEPKMKVTSNGWKVAQVISGSSHFFRGYYDLNYFSRDHSKILLHKLDPSLEDKCEVGYFDLDSKQYHKIFDTKAWCWQQGSRLRWNPVNENQVIFNDVEQDHYCTRIFDIREFKLIRTVPFALYDVTPDLKTGYSLNFSRLQRLRPGYGYKSLPDRTVDEKAPMNDGLFSVNIETGETNLLFSLRELALKCDEDLKYEHYINHISVSPDGHRLIFFHLYKGDGIDGWNVNLYSCDADGSNLRLLESDDRASHYCWIDSQNMLITFHKKDGSEYYSYVNVLTGLKKRLSIRGLEVDGHPNPIPMTESFITDTYPLKRGFQELYQFSKGDKEVTAIAKFYHDYRTRGEMRCDLHPSLSKDGYLLSVDSSFRGGLRSVVILKKQN